MNIALEIKSANIAQKSTRQAIYIYNNLRTHLGLNLRKKGEVHLNPNLKYKSYWINNVNLVQLTI
jgi:hypothetical protein